MLIKEIKQLFCRHNYNLVIYTEHKNRALIRCCKCGKYKEIWLK